MGKDFVTELPETLFSAAQQDIVNIDENIEGKKYPLELKHNSICSRATEAAEKMLKGYIRDYDLSIDIDKRHDLKYLYEKVFEIDSKFQNIKEDLNALNNYTSRARYFRTGKIERHEVINVLKLLKNIYEFELLNNKRIEICSNDSQYVLPNNCLDSIVKTISGIKNKETG
jgi:HEPN domain-containing protein